MTWERDGAALGLDGRRTIYAHRGASAYRPEHTRGAYELAVAAGADVIEPDLVMSADGVLVVRHENEIGATTDIAAHPELAARQATRQVDGREVEGWFAEDLTLAELRELRAVERLPALRPGGARFDGRWPLMTFEEVLDLARELSVRAGRPIGVAPELKHPTHLRAAGHDPIGELVRVLRAHGLDHAGAPLIVQCFEPSALAALRAQVATPLVQLIDAAGAPADGATASYAEMTTPAGLAAIAASAVAIAPHAGLVLPRDDGGRSRRPSTLTADAHRAGLAVIAWTLRPENEFLPIERRRGADPAAHGDLQGYARDLLTAGVDGLFSDDPAAAVAARDELVASGCDTAR